MVRLLRLTLSQPHRCQGPRTGSGKQRRCLCPGAAGALTSALRREQNLSDPVREKEARDGSKKEP